MSVVYGSSYAYRIIISQGHGHIVNTASVFGLFPFALGSAYTAVKQAVVELSLTLRPEAQYLGVRVSVACLCSVDTEVRKSYTILRPTRMHSIPNIQKQVTQGKGVRRNKGLIAFPWYAKFWWHSKLVGPFRKSIRME